MADFYINVIPTFPLLGEDDSGFLEGRILDAAEQIPVGVIIPALYSDMANSALRALKQCEPYDLPKALYKGGWDFMIVEFDPSQMYN